MKNYFKKRLAVSDSVHKFISLKVLDNPKYKNVDDYLRDKLKIK